MHAHTQRSHRFAIEGLESGLAMVWGIHTHAAFGEFACGAGCEDAKRLLAAGGLVEAFCPFVRSNRLWRPRDLPWGPISS